jgi:hypothetical protein
MTDTAVPMPEPSITVPVGGLTEIQQRRVQALEAARHALATRPAMFGGSTVQSWSVGDLLAVADWILTEPDKREGDVHSSQLTFEEGWMNEPPTGSLA